MNITIEFLKDHGRRKKGERHSYHPRKAKPLIDDGTAKEVKCACVAKPKLIEVAAALPAKETAVVDKPEAPKPKKFRTIKRSGKTYDDGDE